jgi:hypothetical protein
VDEGNSDALVMEALVGAGGEAGCTNWTCSVGQARLWPPGRSTGCPGSSQLGQGSE